MGYVLHRQSATNKNVMVLRKTQIITPQDPRDPGHGWVTTIGTKHSMNRFGHSSPTR